MLTAFAILTDGLVYAAYLFVVAIGLSLIFGVMKILNVTHGSFYAFGAYGAAIAVGAYFDGGFPAAGGFLLMGARRHGDRPVLGLTIERGLLRVVYGRDEVVVCWSPTRLPDPRGRDQPAVGHDPMRLSAAGDGRNFAVGGLVLSGYDIGLVVFAVVLALAATSR